MSDSTEQLASMKPYNGATKDCLYLIGAVAHQAVQSDLRSLTMEFMVSETRIKISAKR